MILYVEPQDYQSYCDVYPQYQIENIGQNDQGLNFVRQFILERFTEPFIMADDDIVAIRTRDGKKCDIEEFIKYLESKLHGYAQVGISFCASNWMYKPEVKEDTRASAIKALNPELLRIKDVNFNNQASKTLFEDYEFTMKIIMSGLKTATTYKYMFDTKAKMGTLEGGCKNDWQLEQSKIASLAIKRKYGKFVEIFYNKEHGVYEIQPKWAKLKIYRKMLHGI